MIIETQALTRKFGNFTAVDSLEISIAAGEVFALLGRNGAGKFGCLIVLVTISARLYPKIAG